MKEYIAGTGGRYTYVDDFLNLQELALSMNTIFDGCSNFVISGCEISGLDISEGYVWINGKVRHFEGAKGVGLPYFIYEQNKYETTTYANDINKRGRCNYLCKGATSVPDIDDPISLSRPRFIELREQYTPRFIDKFIGRYALLLDTPFAKQTIKKDLSIEGNITVDKEITTNSSFSINSSASGRVFKSLVTTTGDISIGVYENSLLVNEIVIGTDGSFAFSKLGKELVRFSGSGVQSSSITSTVSRIGSLMIQGSTLSNYNDNTEYGSVDINSIGYNGDNIRYRNFNVYDGKNTARPIFQVEGKTGTTYINGEFFINNLGSGLSIKNTGFAKTDIKLTNIISWKDNNNEQVAYVGYSSKDSFDFSCTNLLGNIVFNPKGYTDIQGEFRIQGKDIDTLFVSINTFTTELNKKVTSIEGKQLSTEDFTTILKKKLDGISTSTISSEGAGYVIASDVVSKLKTKLTSSSNLNDLTDKVKARENLSVLSVNESNITYLRIAGCLKELVSLTADEINGLSPEQASALKAEKQAAIREVLDAEKKGIVNFKLSVQSNLSDLSDTLQARKNISVYSIAEIDKFLAGKLSNDAAYSGIPFTSEHKQKLESIITGKFASVDSEGLPIAQVEGYALITHLVKEFKKKANLLLDGYTESQKIEIAANIGVYSQKGADEKFVTTSNIFQDYINYLVKDGKSTVEAQQILRDKLNVPSVELLKNEYLRKDGKLSDLKVLQADKKIICNHLGAAYAEEYQPKLVDTGWLQMLNSGSGTDTRRLFIRQIGKIVSIQGVINTGKRDGGNNGGVVAKIPNQIEPPKHGLRCSYADFNNDHKYNRGASFKIYGGARNILLFESGWNNQDTEINFTYMI